MRQARVQAGDLFVADRGVPGNAKFSAHVEEVVLNRHQINRDFGGKRFGQQHADDTVQLVHIPQRGNARGVLGRA
ncbi:hypothetical protein D3C72_2025560 [compost metagenome]